MEENIQQNGLDQFYGLRRDFIIIGLTGKMQAGADKFVKILRKRQLGRDDFSYLKKIEDSYKDVSSSESLKIRRIKDFFEEEDNWKRFSIIEYKYVVLLFILNHCYNENPKEFSKNIVNWIIKLGSYKSFETPRFGSETDVSKGGKDYLNGDFFNFLKESIEDLGDLVFLNSKVPLEDKIKENEIDFFFSDEFMGFAEDFFNHLDSFSIYLRHKLIHVASYCLRRFGSLDIKLIDPDVNPDNLENIYIIADVINHIIKKHRECNKKKVHVIIDRLKNSYEMIYFREKYGGFYAVVNNRKESERIRGIEKKINRISEKSLTPDSYLTGNFRNIRRLDETEYKIEEFKKGVFDGFDIENCVQKADYHLWRDEELYKEWREEDFNVTETLKGLPKTNKYYIHQPYLIQVLKLIALIQQPGLIVPTYPERVMQIAFNAKLNSGCISRQVGAVVTDKHFSVKGIGWNDVPEGQTPCSLRDVRDLVEDKSLDVFTSFEKSENKNTYDDEKSFNQKIKSDFEKAGKVKKKLKGRPCAFCFKTFHNAYEGEGNQVHTRSLHAEENAMLQISKYGGQPLKGGNLFTTASPCELCSKKAYQLGIKNIFYIDVYPGISEQQVLKGGKKKNPKLYRYQGVIGKGYQKLYEPFMSIKDETTLITNFRPTETEETKVKQIKEILSSDLSKQGKAEILEEVNKYIEKEK